MTTASDQQCPNCGNTLPEELGQHAQSLVSGSVTCPHCGATVDLQEGTITSASAGDVPRAEAAPPGRHEATDSFSGSETLEGVADELEGKQQG